MSGIRTVLTGREIRLMHDAVLMRFRGLASAQAPGFLKERINGLLGGVELKLDCSTATDSVVSGRQENCSQRLPGRIFSLTATNARPFSRRYFFCCAADTT